jgi:predicted small metal-binding protein
MAAQLKKRECDTECGFMVRSHDEKELVEVASQHVKKIHNMAVSEKDLKAKIKPA